MRRYHDEEWGVPLHDDRALFELLTLEGAQAGLSWLTILRRREGYREVFDGFDITRIAGYTEEDTEARLTDARIIRNRAKVNSTVGNARATLAVQVDFGSLDAFLWRFVDGRPRRNGFTEMAQIPAETDESRAMSHELRRRGFRFVGPTICYAFMQSAGMVNDHLVSCFRYDEVRSRHLGDARPARGPGIRPVPYVQPSSPRTPAKARQAERGGAKTPAPHRRPPARGSGEERTSPC
jgi:DNA-3-methyladenine glycosylase I